MGAGQLTLCKTVMPRSSEEEYLRRRGDHKEISADHCRDRTFEAKVCGERRQGGRCRAVWCSVRAGVDYVLCCE